MGIGSGGLDWVGLAWPGRDGDGIKKGREDYYSTNKLNHLLSRWDD